VALTLQGRVVEHDLHHRLRGELLSSHRRVDETGGDRVDAPPARTPRDRSAGGGADDAALGPRVRDAAVVERLVHSIEEAVRERFLDERFERRIRCEQRDLVCRARREADGGGPRGDEWCEGVEQELGPQQIDLEDPSDRAHRRGDPGCVHEPPERAERRGPLDEVRDGSRVGDVARDADRAVDGRLVEVDGDHVVGHRSHLLDRRTTHPAGRARHHHHAHRSSPPDGSGYRPTTIITTIRSAPDCNHRSGRGDAG